MTQVVIILRHLKKEFFCHEKALAQILLYQLTSQSLSCSFESLIMMFSLSLVELRLLVRKAS
jgi:hypothetical protein